MKNKKRVFKSFQYQECDAFAEYLRKQSLQGWHFKEWRMGLVFEKGEPKDIAYAVEVFPKGKEMDTRPEADAIEFADYCAAAGWKLIDGQRKFCIFSREKEDAVPILTAQERMQNVWKAEGKALFGRLVAPLFLAVGYGIQILGIGQAYWLLNNLMVLLILGIFLITLVDIIMLISLLGWRICAGRKLKNGQQIYYRRRITWDSIMRVGFLGGITVLAYAENERYYMIAVVVTLSICILFDVLLNVWRPSRGENWGIQIGFGVAVPILLFAVIVGIGFSQEESPIPKVNPEEAPFTQMDYSELQGSVSSATREERESILAKESDYTIQFSAEKNTEQGIKYETNHISYLIYESEYPWALDIIWKDRERYLTKYISGWQECAAIWGAEKGVYIGDNHSIYRVQYPDKVMVLYTDGELEPDEIRRIRDKLTVEWEQ